MADEAPTTPPVVPAWDRFVTWLEKQNEYIAFKVDQFVGTHGDVPEHLRERVEAMLLKDREQQ